MTVGDDHSLHYAGQIAKSILDGSVSLLEGARQIAQLATMHGVALDRDFAPFVVFDHRTFDLPAGDSREHWAANSLAEKDAQLSAVESELRVDALEACRRLVERFRESQ